MSIDLSAPGVAVVPVVETAEPTESKNPMDEATERVKAKMKSQSFADTMASVNAEIAVKTAKALASDERRGTPEERAAVLDAAENVVATIHKRDVAEAVPEALTPQMIAYTNSTVKAAISEVLANFLPMLEKLKQPSPKEQRELDEFDKLQERFKREKQQGFEQDAQNRINLELQQKNCSHMDQNNRSALSLTHNYPDRLPRGICVHCRVMIEPAHYILAVPGLDTEAKTNFYLGELAKQGITGWKPFYNPKTGRCTHFLIPEHPLYGRVREQEAKQGQ